MNDSKTHTKLPLRKAIGWILLSTFLFSGSCSIGYVYYRQIKASYANDGRYHIVAVIQSCNDRECLKTSLVAEMLSLSVDKPTNLFRLNVKEAKKKLLDCPVIKAAEIKKIKPGTLFVDSTLRKPIAYIAEFTNSAIDEEGVFIPFNPYYTPKKIPEFVLGLTDIKWGTRADENKFNLASSLLKLMSEHSILVRRIDVSAAFSTNYGEREIVVLLEEQLEKRTAQGKIWPVVSQQMVRLSPQNYLQQLANYLTLRAHLNEKEISKEGEENPSTVIVDMRISQLAFITPIGEKI